MPTYEFRCPSGHDFEKFYRSIGAAPPEVTCPTCGKVAGRQLSAGGGLLFRGSGFYITDYGKDGKKSRTAPPSASDSSASDSSTSDSSTSDSSASAGAADSPAGKPEFATGGDKASGSGREGGAASAKPAVESKPATAAKKPKASE